MTGPLIENFPRLISRPVTLTLNALLTQLLTPDWATSLATDPAGVANAALPPLPPPPPLVPPPPPPPCVVPPPVEAAVAQLAAVIVSLISVTAPLRASARPSTVTPLFIEIEVRARMLPAKVDVVPSVAELPTCQ